MHGDNAGGGRRMKTCTWAVLLLALVLSLVCCGKKSTEGSGPISIEDLLVKNNEITGWTYFGTGWVASGYSELTLFINGRADFYQKHGFVEAANQSYQGTIDGGTRKLHLTVFNQGSAGNAQATYEDPELGLSGSIDWTVGAAGDAAKYAWYGQLSQTLVFYRGQYFVLLEMEYGTEESLNILKQFALNVDGKIE
jgi:hypothetical protein